MPKPLLHPWMHLGLLALGAATMPGCTVVAGLAYDAQVESQIRQCEALPDMADRNACMQRVRATMAQAQDQRAKKQP